MDFDEIEGLLDTTSVKNSEVLIKNENLPSRSSEIAGRSRRDEKNDFSSYSRHEKRRDSYNDYEASDSRRYNSHRDRKSEYRERSRSHSPRDKDRYEDSYFKKDPPSNDFRSMQPPPQSLSAPIDPMQRRREEQFERSEKTVMVLDLNSRITLRELFMFFGRNAGPIRDLQLQQDSVTRDFKGIAFIEFFTAEGLRNALALSGTLLGGVPVKVHHSHALKNAAIDKEKKELKKRQGGGSSVVQEKNESHHFSGVVQSSNSFESVHAVEGGYKSAFPSTQPVVLDPECKVWIGNLPLQIHSEDLKSFFSQFGPVLQVDLPKDTSGVAKGYAFIHFEFKNDAQRCVERVNGGDGVSISDGRRIQAAFANQQQSAIVRNAEAMMKHLHPNTRKVFETLNRENSEQKSRHGNVLVVIGNVYDLDEYFSEWRAGRGAEFFSNLMEDIFMEASNYGRVIRVGKSRADSPEACDCCFWLECGTETDAQKIKNIMDRRELDGKLLIAKVVDYSWWSAMNVQ
eukprot:GDKK01054334.1.p1 GENE.GDKK01054334.1~~GDKK01054334.1.p1  ORF type:complete len:513 (+),score=112.41 GDKK01054334.1:29-1567(+)